MTDVKGFATGQRSDSEEISVRIYAEKHGIPYKKFGRPFEVPEGWVSVGTIEWVLQVTGWDIGAEDNYPSWLSDFFHRRIWKADSWPLHEVVFIKPADKLKRFNGRVTDGSYKGKKKGPYWCSDVVKFTDEWRYYVSNGKVLAAGWYSGQNDGADAPDISGLGIRYPDGWVGTVDFGMTDKGLTLVEAHEPFAVGNYLGINDPAYPEWILAGWEYLVKKYGPPKRANA